MIMKQLQTPKKITFSKLNRALQGDYLKPGLYYLALGEYLLAKEEGLIKSAGFNRGGSKEKPRFSLRTVESVRCNLHVPSLEIFSLKQEGAFLIIQSGNSRDHGLELRLKDGNFTEEELDQFVYINILEEHSANLVYRDSALTHSRAAKYNNPVYAIGSLIKNLFDGYLPAGSQESLGLKQITQIAYVFASKDMGLPEFNYYQVYQHADAITKEYASILEQEKELLPFKTYKKDYQDIAAAVSYYLRFREAYKEFFPKKLSNDAKAAVNSATLFGFIICEKLNPQSRLTYRGKFMTPERLAERLFNNNFTLLSQNIKLLTNRSHKEREVVYQQVLKVLKNSN